MALAMVRERMQRFVSIVLSDADSLNIALTCATMEREALLELSHGRIVSSEATRNADRLMLTCDEFRALFCNPGVKAISNTRRDIGTLQVSLGIVRDR